MLRTEHPPQELSSEKGEEGTWHCLWRQFSLTEEVSFSYTFSAVFLMAVFKVWGFFLSIKWSLNKTTVVLDVINARMSKHGSSGACISGRLGGGGGGGISAAADECSQMPRIFLTHQALSP